MKAAIAVLLLFLASPAGPWAQQQQQHEPDHDATARHSFKNVDVWVERFESPERDAWQKPVQVVRVVGLTHGDTVADLGAGTGYFTRLLTRAVGETGKVYAVDIEPEMLDYIRQRDDLGEAEVTTVLAAADDPRLPDGEIDLVLVVNTWHHIDDRLTYLEKLERALSPQGRVAIVDYHEGELPVGPPAGHKLSRDAVVAEFDKVGWWLASESAVLPYQYLLVFYPPRGN